MLKRTMTGIALLLLSAATVAGGQSVWITTKAHVAQLLLQRAWKLTIDTGEPVKPWPWADVTPVAKLEFSALDSTLIVLSDASGEALAFGPGLVAGKIERAGKAVVAIGGHRDTHLALLAGLPEGSELRLQSGDGYWRDYRLSGHLIADNRKDTVAIAQTRPGLVLITCYPFNARQTGGPLRYVVSAEPARSVTATAQITDKPGHAGGSLTEPLNPVRSGNVTL